MSVTLQDVGPPLFTVVVLSPVAIFSFRYGVPIEIIVFGLLLAGYKGSRWFNDRRRSGLEGASSGAEQKATSEDSGAGRHVPRQDSKPKSFVSWRPWKRGVRSGAEASKSESDEALTWRSRAAEAKARFRPGPKEAKKVEPKSGLAALKKTASQTQYRSIINKLTPEKFDKLCEQLLVLLPLASADSPAASGDAASNAEKCVCSDDEFGKIMDELLSLIFETCSRQHQYTEMYTNLCQKLLDFVAKDRPSLDGRACVWGKIQHIFQTVVLKSPEIPADLPEDEYMDRKVKIKEKMVGMVKLGGDLVARGLVPCEGVMQWIHTLLSEKTQQVYSPQEGEEDTIKEHEKDVEQREVQLEVLCAILASMGSSLSDRNTWSEENRMVIEDVFIQLEQLSLDTENLSLRIRCLIRDILDLRMAQWKEKAGKLKPAMLKPRHKDGEDDLDTVLRSDAPEFVPSSKGGSAWASDRMLEGKPWMEPQLLASLQAVEHHLEVIEDKDGKVQRLKALIQLYNLIQEKQVLIVANMGNLRRILDMISESFGDAHVRSLDQNTPEQTRIQSMLSFVSGQSSILVMSSDVSARREYDVGKAVTVLVNFDFPMTLQLYMFRIQKRADRSTQVYTFFSPHCDVRHTASLIAVLEGASQKVPQALLKLKQQVTESDKADRSRKDQGAAQGSRRGAKTAEASSRTDDVAPSSSTPWKQSRRPAADPRDEEDRGDVHESSRNGGARSSRQRQEPKPEERKRELGDSPGSGDRPPWFADGDARQGESRQAGGSGPSNGRSEPSGGSSGQRSFTDPPGSSASATSTARQRRPGVEGAAASGSGGGDEQPRSRGASSRADTLPSISKSGGNLDASSRGDRRTGR